jgi:hypothetical protein
VSARRAALWIALAVALGCDAGQAPSVAAAPESQKPLDCVPLSEVTSEHVPPDLYRAVPRCLAAGRVAEAIDLYAVAGTFAPFDIDRVTDDLPVQAKLALEAEAEFDVRVHGRRPWRGARGATWT